MVKADITVFFQLLGPYSHDACQTLATVEVNGVGLGVAYPHRHTAPMHGGKGSGHLDLLALAVWLHYHPVVLSIRPGRQPSPNDCFALGRDGEGISTGNPDSVLMFLMFMPSRAWWVPRHWSLTITAPSLAL